LIQAGAGGAASGGTTKTGGAGGWAALKAGDAGTSTEDANGGELVIESGAPQGAGMSVITIGYEHSTHINIGKDANTATKLLGKFACNNATPQGKAAHLIDATDLPTALTRIAGMLVILENYGLMADA
jgi:hypothetical protein